MKPRLYYYVESGEWVEKQDLGGQEPSQEDAGYCLRTTVEILLTLQRHRRGVRGSKSELVTVEIAPRLVRVYEKASRNSTVVLELEPGCREIYVDCRVRGLDDDKKYYRICIRVDRDENLVPCPGYLCEDDVQMLNHD